jgi:hypothetical protein
LLKEERVKKTENKRHFFHTTENFVYMASHCHPIGRGTRYNIPSKISLLGAKASSTSTW